MKTLKNARPGGIKWDINEEDMQLVREIRDRAVALYKKHQVRRDPLEIQMDIVACHLNGCPLRLRELLAGSDFEFIHDVAGIARHIDRTTGQLTGCFLPRFAAPVTR